MALLVLLAVGMLAFLGTFLGPEALEVWRKRKTESALAEAQNALLGYASRYRDAIDQSAVYGYLPLPDLGSTRNNNIDPSCHLNGNTALAALEGCDAANFAGNRTNVTVIGRFPWRALGTGPLRDGHGECLWYAVSGSHKRTQPVSPMNWDTLGQLEVVAANGTAHLAAIAASAHERPVAILFSPGPPLPGQNRGALGNDDVAECGGNYDAANYLDPDTADALDGMTNYFSSAINNASGDTQNNAKQMTTQGIIYRRADNTLWPNVCPSGSDCSLVANDRALTLSADALFAAIRKNANFRFDINAMLDRMTACLRDRLAAGGFTPEPIAGYAAPAGKSAGRIPDDACYNSIPAAYFAHWQDMFFVATANAGSFNVDVDGVPQTCNGVLIFAGQRGAEQSRATPAERANPENYLEGVNLASFTGAGNAFAGPSLLTTVSSAQTAGQDIVRCIPATPTLTTVDSPNPVDLGYSPLANYDASSRTLTLGSADATTGNGIPASSLFGCAWTPEADGRGKGFRAYFAFRFMGVSGNAGDSVGNSGFVFAAIDGERNTAQVCGAAGSHLGYSGTNGVTAPLAWPKIGIEFDLARDTGLISNSPDSGRNDPCGISSCGGTAGYNSHSAIVYWGDRSLDYDDNAHGVGTPPADPRNPDRTTPTGIAFIDYRSKEDANNDGVPDSYLYHVRIEVVPTRNPDPATAGLGATTLTTSVWIRRDSATTTSLIAALQNTTRPMSALYPNTGPTLTDTAAIPDVAGQACGNSCPENQSCGADNRCYRQGMKPLRLGFTSAQQAQGQQVIISNFSASWPQ
ncbi:MAG: hypothetical protein LBP94_01095 [Zoogloeaceae bacterium]|jgi:hypothetical protein|nr:hypothetical protein [Zoogloeaceae bacterium]